MKSFAPLLTSRNKIWFLGLDVLLFLLAVVVATKTRAGLNSEDIPLSIELLLLTLVVPTVQYVFGNYDLDHVTHARQLLARQATAISLTFVAASLFTFLFATVRAGVFGRGILFTSLAIFFLLSVAYRLCVVEYFKSVKGKLKWLVLTDPKSQEIVKKDFHDLNFEGTIEFFDPSMGTQALTSWLGNKWSTIVIAINDPALQTELGPLIIEAKCSGLNTITITEFYERHLRKVPLHMLDYNWFINAGGFYSITHPVQLRLKRLMDIAISALMLLLASPIMLLVALAIKLESHGPAIYKQIRTGKDNKPFTIYKFRSMGTDAEKNGAQWAIQNDQRITQVGKFIRLTRLDELPQLWNVLKGEMSFVGPRPERPEFNEMLKKELPYYELRHVLRPGITGWAQVLYPYGASVQDSMQKLQFELYYIKHSGIILDLMIILKTIRVVIGARGR